MDFVEFIIKVVVVVVGGDSGFVKKVKFDFGDVGKLFIDGVVGVVNNDDVEVDVMVKVDWEDFGKLVVG